MRALTIALAVALVAFASMASAFTSFNGVGTGDFMDSPPTFIGNMEAPGDILDGSWTITVPDDGWPTDPVAREAYIWTTFYAGNYEPGTPGFWKGYFDASTNGAQNTLAIVDNTASRPSRSRFRTSTATASSTRASSARAATPASSSSSATARASTMAGAVTATSTAATPRTARARPRRGPSACTCGSPTARRRSRTRRGVPSRRSTTSSAPRPVQGRLRQPRFRLLPPAGLASKRR